MLYDVDRAATMMTTIVRDWDVGYGQGDGWGGRWDVRDGGAVDCSSAVSWAVNSGFNAIVLDHSTYTGNLAERLTNLGFSALAGNTTPQVGDVILASGHVAMCVAPGILAEAWINERGGILGGAPGDQTGQETRLIAYDDHPFTLTGRWISTFRPPASSQSQAVRNLTASSFRGKNMFIVKTTTPWNEVVYALITENSGAYGLNEQQAGAYQIGIGACGQAPWDWWNLLVAEAWQRYETNLRTLGQKMTETVEEATQRVIKAASEQASQSKA